MPATKNTLFLATLLLLGTQCFGFAPSQANFVSKSRNALSPELRLQARKPKEDLSYIESRDLTREEMLDLNAQNEEIMNMELSMMTGFSLILSLPILYLCWVAFFSE